MLLQYWALEACQCDHISKDHGLAPEAKSDGSAALWRASERRNYQHWSDTLRQAKETGDIRVHACAHSMEVFGLDTEGHGSDCGRRGRRGLVPGERRRTGRLHLKERAMDGVQVDREILRK